MRYEVLRGGITALPRFVEGTEATLLIPRPRTPLGAVIFPCDSSITNQDIRGNWSSSHHVKRGDFHIMPQVGYQYAVAASNVEVPGLPNPGARFRLGTQDNYSLRIAPAMKRHWSDCGFNVEVYKLFRRHAAYVYGEVAITAERGKLKVARVFSANICYDGWPGQRLLLISETRRQGEVSTGRGMRLVPHTHLGREFERWRSHDRVIEEFTIHSR